MAPLYSVFTIAGDTAVRAHTARQLDTGLGIVTSNTLVVVTVESEQL